MRETYQVTRFMFDGVGESGCGGDRRSEGPKFAGEYEGVVGLVLVANVHGFAQAEEVSVLAKCRVITTNKDGRVSVAGIGACGREDHARARERLRQLRNHIRNDLLFFPGQFTCYLERWHVDIIEDDRAVVSHVLHTVKIQIDDLPVKLIRTRIDQIKTGKLRKPSARQ